MTRSRELSTGARLPRGQRKGGTRRAWRLLAVLALGASGSLALGAGTAAADSCANAAFRFGAGANLPDCRGYELVSPVDSNGYDISFGNEAVAPDGNSVTYSSLGSFSGAPSGSFNNQYLSTRNPSSGWSTVATSPPQDPGYSSPQGSLYEGFSSDLSEGVVESDHTTLDGAAPGTLDMYLRQGDGSFHLLDPGEPQGITSEPGFVGGASDLSRIVFASVGALTPNAPNDSNDKLYEWEADGTGGCASAGGCLTLVSVLPDGAGADGRAGALPGNPWPHVVSDDGQRVYWMPPGSASTIYLWQSSTPTTSTQIDLGQCKTNPRCTTTPTSATWWTASADGSEALFTSTDVLTDNSTANGNGTGSGDLYAYDAGTGGLQDLTPDTTPGDSAGADVQGVVGRSSDGSYVYFVANGRLGPAASQLTKGNCGSNSSTSSCNLYLWHGAPGGQGTITYLARVAGADSADWAGTRNFTGSFGLSEAAQVSADGLHLLFTSVQPLTGFANGGHTEIYLYSAAVGQLSCVSCSGPAPAVADSSLAPPPNFGLGEINLDVTPLNNMSSDGRTVFFETADPLLAQATNGTTNVYEWEASGAGSCAATGGGCLYLISSGQSSSPSAFLDASPSGNDVFFLTREPLTGAGNGENLDVYDARVGGGFPAPTTPTPCTGDGCRPAPSPPPAAPVAASVTFTGSGNLSGSIAAATAARARVLSKTVHGITFSIRVEVPAKGAITISGRSIRLFRIAVARSGTYTFRLTLTSKARRLLAKRHKLRIRVRVSYTPSGGTTAAATFSITVKPRRATGGRRRA